MEVKQRGLGRPTAAPTTRSPQDRYWDAYQRTVMPGELLAICFVGATISIGVAVSLFAFLPW